MANQECSWISSDSPTVKELNLDSSYEILVLNRSTHITVDGSLIHPKSSPFIWMGHFIRSKKGSENVASNSLASVACHTFSLPSSIKKFDHCPGRELSAKFCIRLVSDWGACASFSL